MLELGPAQECEMILAFLKAEVDSSRFADTVNTWIAAKSFTRNQLIENADLSDREQNQARLGILRGYRGYGRNEYLFRGFPHDVVWRHVELEPHELDNLKYAKELSWLQMSDGTRKLSCLIEKLNRGEIAPNPADHIRAIQQSWTEGKKFPELIAVEGQGSELILVEGHSRATAYLASRLNEGIKMFLASSPTMSRWAYYQLSYHLVIEAMVTEAEKLYNETYARWLSTYSVILGFRNSFTEVSDAVADRLQAKSVSLFRDLIEDPQWKGLLLVKPDSEKTRTFGERDQQLAMSSAGALFTQNYGSLDAATLVFFHSVLDAIVLDQCRVTALHTPEDWEEDLKQAQISLLDAKSKPYEQILTARIEKHLERLEGNSLCIKMDRLFARCQPPAGWSPMEGYIFDRKIIEAFDEQRHAIIHGKALGKPLSIFAISDDSLHYLMQTGMYLMVLVNFKYKLQIDPNYIEKFWQQA